MSTESPERRVTLLHVEDDEMQCRLIAAHLATMEKLRFNIIYAASEVEAMVAFGRARFDLVIIDYHLREGNGLKCLQSFRRRNPIVAIIAVSGAEDPETAKTLLRAGADDFLPKANLTSEGLHQTIRAALAKTDRWRQHIPDGIDDRMDQAEAALRKLCDRFVQALGLGWLSELDTVEELIQRAGMLEAALETQFQLASSDAETPALAGQTQRLLRPLLLELLTRQSEKYV
jgi:DNA-binding NarL/FixJ family response regulator